MSFHPSSIDAVIALAWDLMDLALETSEARDDHRLRTRIHLARHELAWIKGYRLGVRGAELARQVPLNQFGSPDSEGHEATLGELLTVPQPSPEQARVSRKPAHRDPQAVFQGHHVAGPCPHCGGRASAEQSK